MENFTVTDSLSLHVSKICSAFSKKAIGTKVTHDAAFKAALALAIERYDMPLSGQAKIPVPDAIDLVSCGVGHLDDTIEESDFVIRRHRGKWGLYLRREKATKTESLHCVVYTRQAYLKDPDVSVDELAEMGNATHIIVAVLAAAGPNPPLPIGTLVHNIAGGNNEYKPELKDMTSWVDWLIELEEKGDIRATANDLALLHNFIDQAKESEHYWAEWAIVAD